MQREGYELGLETFNDLFRGQTSSLVWQNGTLNRYVHVPAYKIDSRLRLLEHIPVPLILPEIVVQQSRGGYKNTAMFIQPLHTIVAVQTGGSAFKVFTRAELNACQLLGSTYFCPNNNILDKRTKFNWVLGLYNRDQAVITDHCPWVYIMEGQRNFSLSVDTFIEKHVNVEELFNSSRLHVINMACILQDPDLEGSTTGLTIANIQDGHSNFISEGTLIWITRYVVIGLTVIGLVGVVWFLHKKYLKAKKDTRPLLIKFRELFSSNKPPRNHEMQERGDRSDSDENEDVSGCRDPR
jgi:hypothetical protein